MMDTAKPIRIIPIRGSENLDIIVQPYLKFFFYAFTFDN